MTREQALELLKQLVNEVDYDHYKSIFVESCMEDPEASMRVQENLLLILGKYVEIEE